MTATDEGKCIFMFAMMTGGKGVVLTRRDVRGYANKAGACR
jgi:hypothetical protein